MKIHNITMGTAGHIDHGKSELIRRLTGVHPDRLKEEKERGMTIDLGYSDYETASGLRVGVIDVPGHEKFVKNMVAGAASIDLVLLVVAADDGVMPQTREHLMIMTYLGIEKGVIALTKTDLVDGEIIELATEEVRDFLHETFLDGAPIIPVSSLTGKGIDHLRNTVDKAIASVDPAAVTGAFRMPIQRAFTRNGFGTVVTGVPVSGTARVGDQMEIFPLGTKGKIRNIQAYNESCELARAGHRVALNISDVDYHALHRGQVAAAPRSFRSTLYFEAEFHLAESARAPLDNMTGVKVHTGTAEVLATIVLLDRKAVEPGDSAPVQLRLRDPVVVVPGDRFILRLNSPALTLGGGTIVGLTPIKLKRFKEYILRRVAARRDCAGDLEAMIAMEARNHGDIFLSSRDLSIALNFPRGQIADAVTRLRNRHEVVEVHNDLFAHREHFDRLAGKVQSGLEEAHRKNPLSAYVSTGIVKDITGLEGKHLFGFLDVLSRHGLVERAKGGLVRLAGFVPEVTDADLVLMDGIEERIRKYGATPPLIGDLAGEIANEIAAENADVEKSITTEAAESTIRTMVEMKRLVKVAAFVFHPSIYEAMRDCVVEIITEYGEVNFSAIRDRFSTTRKWIIPLLDHFDSIGLTCWVGNKRQLTKSEFQKNKNSN